MALLDVLTENLAQDKSSEAGPLWSDFIDFVQQPSQSQSSPLADPLLLQLSILETTDAVQHEMNSISWQADRALGGGEKILAEFAKLQPQFAKIDDQLSDGGILRHLHILSFDSDRWRGKWSQLEMYIEVVNDLYDLINLHQDIMVNESTLRMYSVIESIRQVACANPYDTVDDNATHPSPRNPKCHGSIFQILANEITQVSSTPIFSFFLINC